MRHILSVFKAVMPMTFVIAGTVVGAPSSLPPPNIGPASASTPSSLNALGRICKANAFQPYLPVNAKVESVYVVQTGGTAGEGPPDIAYPVNPTNLPEMCVVTVNVTSSPRSNYRFGLFLPTKWNHRFLAVGNGAFAGGINWLDMGAGAQYGFAAMSTDTGHNSTAIDLTWANQNPDRQQDFGFRSIHGSSTIAQSLVEHYYGQCASYSYYSGCSTGGRQGLKETSMYQTTFDGMLIGSAAWWASHLSPWTTKIGIYDLPFGGPNYVSPAMFPVIGAEVVRQCDAADGVIDGIVSAPGACNFDFGPLSCSSPGADPSNCLTAPQIQTVINIRSNYIADGKFAFPGLEKGSEFQWFISVGAPEPSPLGEDYIRYFLLNNASWQWEDYNDNLVWKADAQDPGNLTPGYDLSTFKSNGGKLLMYHGIGDGLVATNSTLVYREKVAQTMTGGNEASLNGWYRTFLVPGMGHCTGTSMNSPWYFAGGNQAGTLGTSTYSTPGFPDAQHDALLALISWVENGNAPDSIVATTWNNPQDPTSGVLRQRPLCPFPETAKLKPGKNETLATSWVCS